MGLILFSHSFLHAQTTPPSGINYQAIARNDKGLEFLNTPIVLRFSINAVSASGTLQYQETQTATTNQFGLVTLVIGNGTKTGGLASSLSSIDWRSNPQFLTVELSINNGTSFLPMGSAQYLAVPYAFSAARVNGFGPGVANYIPKWASNGLSVTGTSGIYDDGTTISLLGNVSITGLRTFITASPPLSFNAITGVISSNISASAPLSFNPVTGVISYNSAGSPGGISIPAGTTGQRTPTPTVGTMRFNTDLSTMEVYDGSKWLNINTPPIGATYIQWSQAANPNTIYPNTSWTGSDFQNGEFIRAWGGNSSITFGSTLTAVVQQHAVQDHSHGLIGGINGSGILTSNAVNLNHDHGGSTLSDNANHGHSASGGDHSHTSQNNGSHSHQIKFNQNGLGVGSFSGMPPVYSDVDPTIHVRDTELDGDHNHVINSSGALSITVNNNNAPHSHGINSSLSSSQTFTISSHAHTNNFSVGNMSSGTSATETRPINKTVIFWRRVN